MRHYIDTEIKLANEFVQNTGNEWAKFDKEWIENNFGTFTKTISDNYEDVEVCLIRTNV
jgi:hypothetical protein